MVRMIALALGVLAAWPAMAESGLSNQDCSGAVQWCGPAKLQHPFCITAKPQQSITAPAPPPLTIGTLPGGHTSQWITEPPAITAPAQTTITVPAGSVATFPGGQLTGPVTIEIRPATHPAPR